MGNLKLPLLGILGAQGRMGRIVSKLVGREYSDRWQLGAEWDRGSSVAPLLACDAWIDFSAPEGLLEALRAIEPSTQKIPVVIAGSTGWTETQSEELHTLAQRVLLLQSFNFSLGVLALLRILDEASPLLLGLGYHPVIRETHHRHKKDSPSGTAKMIHAALGEGAGQPVPIHSVRAGEVVGDHEIAFFGDADSLTLTHHAQDRTIFARGALDLAAWLLERHRADPPSRGLVKIKSYLDEKIRSKNL